MSANGSPIQVFGGARATFGAHESVDAAPLIQVALADGQEIDATDVNGIAELSSEAREEARGKLQLMQVRTP
jgi:hypothetical protein